MIAPILVALSLRAMPLTLHSQSREEALAKAVLDESLLLAEPLPSGFEAVEAIRGTNWLAFAGPVGSAVRRADGGHKGASKKLNPLSPGEEAALDALGDFFTVVAVIAGVLVGAGLLVGLAYRNGNELWNPRAGTPPDSPTSLAAIRF